MPNNNVDGIKQKYYNENMDKYKLFLQSYIENTLENIDKLTFSKTDDFVKGQLYTYYDMIKSFRRYAIEYKIPLKELGLEMFRDNILVNIDRSSRIFRTIKGIINNWDPYDLLSAGASDDEYEPEIEEIIFRMKNENTLNEITNIVSDVFSKSFNDPIHFSIENCAGVAEIIKNNVR
jgi:hypothetical protein